MRRSALAIALLLAAAPAARGAEPASEVRPSVQPVEAVAPAIRKHVALAPARAGARTTETSRAQPVSHRTFIVLLAILAAVVVIGSVI